MKKTKKKKLSNLKLLMEVQLASLGQHQKELIRTSLKISKRRNRRRKKKKFQKRDQNSIFQV